MGNPILDLFIITYTILVLFGIGFTVMLTILFIVKTFGVAIGLLIGAFTNEQKSKKKNDSYIT